MLFEKIDLENGVKQEGKSEDVFLVESERTGSACNNISCKSDLSKYIIGFEKDIDIISNGAFSMHQLVHHIISVIAQPCNIYATTWATSETIVTSLVNMKRKGLIENCFFLFDHRVMRYRPNAYLLFEQNFNCKILSIHAKICVIESKDISVRIVGSGNWTRNDKVEVYNISSNKETCNFHKAYILNELKRI